MALRTLRLGSLCRSPHPPPGPILLSPAHSCSGGRGMDPLPLSITSGHHPGTTSVICDPLQQAITSSRAPAQVPDPSAAPYHHPPPWCSLQPWPGPSQAHMVETCKPIGWALISTSHTRTESKSQPQPTRASESVTANLRENASTPRGDGHWWMLRCEYGHHHRSRKW